MRAMLAVSAVVLAIIVAVVASLLSSTDAELVIQLAEGKKRPQGGILTGAYSEPRNLNPFTTTDLVAQRLVLQFTHEALLDWNPDTGNLRPALAESYEQGVDDRTWVFKIRKGVRFSNGAPVTMTDVRFAFDVSRRTKVALGSMGHALGLIENAEVHGRALHLRLREPGLSSLSTVATGYLVVSSGYFTNWVRDLAGDYKRKMYIWSLVEKHLHELQDPGPGTGPYRLQWWRRGRELLLVQNLHCWRQTAQPDRWNLAGMRLRFVQDQTARFTLLRQGSVDILVDPNVRGLVSKHPELSDTYRVRIYDQIRGGNFVLLWNHRRRFLGDARVRRALTQCFDRDAIANTLMSGQGKVSSTWFRPGSPEAKDAPEPLPYDPVAAGRLLAEAGVGEGQELTLEVIIAGGQPLHRRILEFAQTALRELPVKLEILPMEWPAMSARLKQHDFDGMLLFLSLDPVEDPYPNFHSKGSLNRMGYKNATVDRLLEQGRRTTDPNQRLAFYARFNEVFHQEQPVTLLAYPLTGVILSRRFKDAEPNRLGLYPERWWVNPR